MIRVSLSLHGNSEVGAVCRIVTTIKREQEGQICWVSLKILKNLRMLTSLFEFRRVICFDQFRDPALLTHRMSVNSVLL